MFEVNESCLNISSIYSTRIIPFISKCSFVDLINFSFKSNLSNITELILKSYTISIQDVISFTQLKKLEFNYDNLIGIDLNIRIIYHSISLTQIYSIKQILNKFISQFKHLHEYLLDIVMNYYHLYIITLIIVLVFKHYH